MDAGVNAQVYVHDLGDLEVYADAREGVGVLGVQVLGLGEERDRLPDSLLHRIVEVFVYAGALQISPAYISLEKVCRTKSMGGFTTEFSAFPTVFPGFFTISSIGFVILDTL